ncbi:hypothetical protein GFS31_09230 [Leptolyngbya sp. BL0902]|uniref:COP23 domain-containing protein n=1 Tax=Leptolyngbya sp. BL0902 TaxID=1115757 RepID=UPI0018E77EF8|nr:COP23 domain-containing protein [Leptolyngbya sp. BL0902]QQE64243.1 hypothetical protein GFS31_09230 [Leptolyngbya sp. BL0902]
MAVLTHPWSKRLTVGASLAFVTLATGLSLSSLAQTTDPAPEPTAEGETPTPETTSASSFACQMYQGRPTVMYAPSSQPGQMYPWAVPQDMGTAWPAQRRCEAISARLESYRPDGLLTLDTGMENGYNTVCVTTEATPGCRIVFTVPPGQDPTLTRDQVFGNLASADQGRTTEGVTTFADGNNSSILGQIGNILGVPSGSTGTRVSGGAINLQPFLAPSDGGTGARLTGTSTAPQPTGGRTLNPDNFR